MDTYENKYKDLVKAVKELQEANPSDEGIQNWVNENVPELKESEDDRMRKALIDFFSEPGRKEYILNGFTVGDIIAWLEKQREQKSQRIISAEAKEALLPAEPKYQIGDWVVLSENEVAQVFNIRNGRYWFNDMCHYSWSIKECDEKTHLWTIKDAKEGDVLEFDFGVGIFKGNADKYNAYCYCYYNDEDGFVVSNDELLDEYQATPAIKERRGFLFQKMHEAGYEWNADKRELKKIEQNPVKVPKFKVGDFIQFNGMGHTIYTIKEVCGLSHYINSFDRRMDMAYTDANFELVEQKPAAWSEEDEKFDIEIPFGAKDSELIEEEMTIPEGCYAFIQGDKIVIRKGEKPVEWTEKDEKYMNDLEKYFDGAGLKNPSEDIVGWVKTFKDRVQPQPKQEWSEEDEYCRNQLIVFCENCMVPDSGAKRCAHWIKSLKERYTWKPSDLPHWKKSTLPNDNTTGFNSDFFCLKGYCINYKELFERLPKDD